MTNTTKTYCTPLIGNQEFFDFLFLASQESGKIYSQSLSEFWKHLNQTGEWLSKFDLQKHMKGKMERKFLHSDSFLGSMQQVHSNLSSWKEAKKINPEAKPPYKEKFFQNIFFKQSQIRRNKNKLILSLGTDANGKKVYHHLIWEKNLPTPHYGSISYSRKTGWKINLVFDQDVRRLELDLNNEKVAGIDLGVKRIATIYDGDEILTISGKKFMGLTRQQNKLAGDKEQKLSRKKRGSNRSKKLRRGYRRKNRKINNVKSDMLHKTSRFVVEHLKEKGITHVFVGDCSSIHDKTNLGKVNNQIVQQNPEMRLFGYIKQKFEMETNGVCEKIDERYTSRTCPSCKHVHENSPKGREFVCQECGYEQDRDGVGGINICHRGEDKLEKQKEERQKQEQTSEFVCEKQDVLEERNVLEGQGVFEEPFLRSKNVSFHVNDIDVGRRGLLARPYGVKVKENLSYRNHKLPVNSSSKEEGKSEKPSKENC